jgi:hypothetical protein
MALPIGPDSQQKFMLELGLEGFYLLHPVPFRNFGGGAAKLVPMQTGNISFAWAVPACSGGKRGDRRQFSAN